jgi:MFS family permease
MQDYGWRLMFATGIAPVAFALFIRKSLDESPVFTAQDRGPSAAPPFLAVLRPPELWAFLQVFAFMTGLFLTDYAVYQFLPVILQGPGKFDLVRYTFIYGVALLCAFLGYNLYGRLSDRWGRRKMTMWYCLCVALLGVPLYKLLIFAASTRSLALALAAAIMAACFKVAWGIVPAYLSERFPTRSRSAGVGLGYSAGALLGGGFIVPLVGLLHGLPVVKAIEGGQELWLSASCALTLGAVITFLSLVWSPETKDVDLKGPSAGKPVQKYSKIA